MAAVIRNEHLGKQKNKYLRAFIGSGVFFFGNPMDVDKLISGTSAFSKSSMNIWKFTVHVLLKPGLENLVHYFTSM